MNGCIENDTALLATALGGSLLTAGAIDQNTGGLDARTAKEIAVLSRVLEQRLGKMRESIARVARKGGGSCHPTST